MQAFNSELYRLDFNELSSRIRLNNVNQSFTTCLNEPGDKLIKRATFAFSNNQIIVKLSIDGTVLLEVDLRKFDNLLGGRAWGSIDTFGPLEINADNNSFSWVPEEPAYVATSLLLEAKANNGSNGRDFLGYALMWRN